MDGISITRQGLAVVEAKPYEAGCQEQKPAPEMSKGNVRHERVHRSFDKKLREYVRSASQMVVKGNLLMTALAAKIPRRRIGN
jgi:hypothetical protein